MSFLVVGVGGFFGAICRYLIGQFAKRNFRTKFPVGTLIINLIGCFCLGLLTPVTGPIALLLGTGFLGAFTTFSTFKLESLQLHLSKEWKLFFSYICISYIGGIGLALLGITLASQMHFNLASGHSLFAGDPLASQLLGSHRDFLFRLGRHAGLPEIRLF